MKKRPESELPARLLEILDGLADRELATRLSDVCLAAGQCIGQLAAIRLVDLEPKVADEGPADLALWEKMAPAVRDTVLVVNELCEVVDECFPPDSGRHSALGAAGSDQRAEQEATSVFQTLARFLRKEVTEVGGLMRRPELVASGWALLGELQRLRGHLRQRVSDAVYLSAAALAPVSRTDVVPGFAQEVRRGLSFRGTQAALQRTVEGRLEEAADGPAVARAIGEDLSVFTAMPAWRHVQIETKRQLLALQGQLGALAAAPGTTPEDVARLARPFMATLAATAGELSRGLLAGPDRQARAAALLKVEQCELHLVLETGAASWALDAALTAADPLRGRDEALDDVLRRAGNLPVGALADEELMPLVAALGAALTRLEI